jgi:hypothetical protein
MSDKAATHHEELDQIALKMLQAASKLPPGERHDFLKEIGIIRSQISALKAKGK